MCGINGFYKPSSLSENELSKVIHRMNDLIIHRGPDDDGLYTFSSNHYSVAMGMRRLSIIDLSTGKQPILSDDGNIIITFNGEIYNFLELRDELKRRGIQFKTQSDTEVILRLYEQKGVDGFRELDGMFAFSILDKRKNQVLIARDFFGEKPLYYTNNENKSIWASELK